MANWIKDNKPYTPSDTIRGIVYVMEYNNKRYIGKKVIRDKMGKLLKYQDYMGSSIHWKDFIKGNEDKVIRRVLFECANKVEMAFFEDYLIASRFAIWDDQYLNGNLGMLVNTRNSKNFHNIQYIKDKIDENKETDIDETP